MHRFFRMTALIFFFCSIFAAPAFAQDAKWPD